MTARLYCGDALTVLQRLPDGSARCCVTSPPYWGLRDYGTATWDGGDAECDHIGTPLVSAKSGLRNDGREHTGPYEGEKKVVAGMPFRHDCAKCGARRIDAQLGLERTPEEYIANMVEVFREVRRVLTDDGTLWLNLGDSYATGAGAVGDRPGGGSQGDRARSISAMTQPNRMPIVGLKPKDLVGIPWRVAFALQADGCYLRSDIIWAKPNPMPESVTDRPTKAHEYVFLLSKSARYFYDAAAIAEGLAEASIQRIQQATFDLQTGGPKGYGEGSNRSARRALVNLKQSLHMRETQRNDGDRWRQVDGGVAPRGTRNARTVWTIATQPYPQAHFATFPEELARRCILAGSAPGDTVLDPFGGSGTVAQVATGNGRNAIHIDLNPAYIELAQQRIGRLLCEVALMEATP